VPTGTSNLPISSIYTRNDDLLLHTFDVYRLANPDEYEHDGGKHKIYWDHQRWSYKLVHVCPFEEILFLDIPFDWTSILFVCTCGVYVADMLAHLPLPRLIIDYHHDEWEITAEDKSSILPTLFHRNRVHRVSILVPTSNKNKNKNRLIMAMNCKLQIPERMFIDILTDQLTDLTFTLERLQPRIHDRSRLSRGTHIAPVYSSIFAGIVEGRVT
jgi:hypothetical protein